MVTLLPDGAPLRPIRSRLVHDAEHGDVLDAITRAQTSVWIATANLKEVMVPGARRTRGRWGSILDVLDDLARDGVELRLLHASLPSRAFRRRFDKLPALIRGGIELRQCPRVHLKLVAVDGCWAYFGSANWTGAGLGNKNEHRRNFELGMVTDDTAVLDSLQARFDRIWRGAECGKCKLRDVCPAPLDVG